MMRDLARRAAWRALLRLEPRLSSDLALLDYCRRFVLPAARAAGGDLAPFVPAVRLGHAGIDLREAEQLERLRSWRDRHAPLFADLRQERRINTLCPGSPYLHNGMFPTPDAEIYAAMILDERPRQILEVGAGFSTLVARAAVARLGGGCRITVVDPEPRTDVTEAADTIVRAPVEEGGLEPFLGEAGLLLFIDSSHIVRGGGDVSYLYTQALPRLAAGTLVHVHDIYLPYEYPEEYQRRLYTEQYLLQALLAHSPRYRVIFAAHWMAREQPGAMREVFGPAVGREPGYFGASFWFRVV